MSTFNLFAYGTLRPGQPQAARLLAGCTPAGEAHVGGVLYDIEGKYPALLLYGDAPVHGVIWRCPADLLLRLDEYEGHTEGLFRRVAVEARNGAGRVPCWAYVAGPALSRRLVPERRIVGGRWPAAGIAGNRML